MLWTFYSHKVTIPHSNGVMIISQSQSTPGQLRLIQNLSNHSVSLSYPFMLATFCRLSHHMAEGVQLNSLLVDMFPERYTLNLLQTKVHRHYIAVHVPQSTSHSITKDGSNAQLIMKRIPLWSLRLTQCPGSKKIALNTFRHKTNIMLLNDRYYSSKWFLERKTKPQTK